MADTYISQELRDFMQKNNLDPLNFVSIANLLMKQQEQIDEIAKHVWVKKVIWMWVREVSLYDIWYNK